MIEEKETSRGSEEELGLSTISEAMGVPIPKQLEKTFLNIIGKLMVTSADALLAWIERKRDISRAYTAAEVSTINKTGAEVCSLITPDEKYVKLITDKHTRKILGHQEAINEITLDALRQVCLSDIPVQEQEAIDEEWLNKFEDTAKHSTTEEMKCRFANLLAGKIINPSSFPKSVIRILDELDKSSAELFINFCACLIFNINTGGNNKGELFDGRVCSLGTNMEDNGLADCKVNYGTLTILREAGLVGASSSSYSDYGFMVYNGHPMVQGLQVHLGGTPIKLSNNGLRNRTDIQSMVEFKVSGCALTNAGKAVAAIIDFEPNLAYREKFIEYMSRNQVIVTMA